MRSDQDLGELLEKASGLQGEARARFLAGLRADDAELADFVQALLLVAGPDGESSEPGSSRSRLHDSAQADFVAAILDRLARRRDGERRYAIQDEVASGGQGAVLRVWDEDLRRSLAMKVILAQRHAHRDGTAPKVAPRILLRFLEEAQVTGRLDHPGIVPVHELGLDSAGRVYFTMKLVEGQDLQQVFRLLHGGHAGWTHTRALNVMLKVCDAMAYAHSKGVIHRDLKPANVMVGKFGEVYVMDWGLARVGDREDSRDLRIRPPAGDGGPKGDPLSSDSPLVTMDGDVVGTPCYMSPEQSRGDLSAMGPQSDVYAVGAMLYHLLAGHPPYVSPGTSPMHFAVLFRLQKEAPRSLRKIAPDAPAELAAICEKAMERDASRRYGDMSELAADLRAFLENRVVAAHETGAVAELRKWMQRNKGLATAIATAVLATIGGLATVSYVQAGRRRLAEEKAEEGRRVLQLSAFRTLRDLRQRAETLWPAIPRNEEAYEQWLDDARELIASLEPVPGSEYPGHRRQLENLRGLDTPEDTWWESQLERLVREIESLSEAESGLIRGTSSEHGWGIQVRLDHARTIEQRSVSGPGVRVRWEEARAAIAVHRAYGGLDLEPQLGLVPIGIDPESGLWEFWHVPTGGEPERHAAGPLLLGPDTGLVFVLAPQGRFWMGAQADHAEGRNYDPNARSEEGPVHEVVLPAFFLSKFEMTQGQWERASGSNPSTYGTGFLYWPDPDARPFQLSHPVENVTWTEAHRLMGRLGLGLPTEAQWEYATRGGASSVWWSGDDPSLLADVANLADAYADAFARTWFCEPWNDGHFFHAPVGTYRANAFGLHDVHGNLWEWCLDGYDDECAYSVDVVSVDPRTDPTRAEQRVGRGGGFDDRASLARSAERGGGRSDHRSSSMGLRPARAVER